MKPDDPRLIRIERSLAWAQIANVTATPSNSRIRNLFNLLHLRSQDLACPSFSDPRTDKGEVQSSSDDIRYRPYRCA